MSEKWLTQSATDLGRGIQAGEIDPILLAETYLDAIETHVLSPRIYARITKKRALAEAEAARDRASEGFRRGLLDGVPISWKDLFDTAGTATEAGSDLLKNRTPDRDAKVLQNATAVGLVCLGKTHMSELAFSGLGLNPVTQTPPCVNDLDAVSGGSSSGAATSVAFNLAAAAIGSDTGGSVRIPAAWNDLVGFKTSSGVVSLEGVVPLCKSFDTVGPLTRTVEDAAEIYTALQGEKPTDITRVSLKGTRLAICKTLAFDEIETTPDTAFHSAIEKLREAGAEIVTIDVPQAPDALDFAGCLYTSEAYAQWKDVIEANPDLMFAEILSRFRAGKNYSSVEFIHAWDTLQKLRTEYSANTSEFDAVLMPSSPVLPPNAARLISDSEYYVRANLLALRNTRIGNMLGLTSLSLPTSTKSCGLMINMPPSSEAKLLRLGAGIEAALNS